VNGVLRLRSRRDMKHVDLNCDLGEGAGHDSELMAFISSANIACGAHAGDQNTMVEAVALARGHGVAIGAHPGHADRANFGRFERAISPSAAARLVAQQIARLHAVAGDALVHVKLHGALYHQVSSDADLADAVVVELAERWPELTLFAQAGSELLRVGQGHGLKVAAEVFADRTYLPDGRLTPRSRPDAVMVDAEKAVRQVLRMVQEGKARAVDGTELPIEVDTVCLHSDGPNAVGFARRLRRELERAGVAIRSPGK